MFSTVGIPLLPAPAVAFGQGWHSVGPLIRPCRMGLQPGSITVTSEGLLIGFVAKPLR